MINPNCHLQPWEAAQCPKLGSTFEQIVEKLKEVDSLLSKWASEPGLCHEFNMRILGILFIMNQAPPMLEDLDFPYVEVMRHYSEMEEALKVPEISEADLKD